jgi:ABC-type amino acid transport system permease subunit
MTCDEVRELILFVPLSEHGPQARSVIEAHTEGCQRCQALWREELSLSERLLELPEIRMRSNTVSRVLARVAAIDEYRAGVAVGRARSAESGATWRPWAASAGLAAMLAIYLYVVIGEQTGFEFWSPRVGFGQLTGMLSAPTVIAFIVALFAYIAGMFAFGPADDP